MPAGVLVIGSANRKKALELAELFAPLGVVVKSLADFPDCPQVPETDHTFAENAALKACGLAQALGQWVLADDSGLCVDALGGDPGVRSARYSGAQATDAANNRLLLEKLAGVPLDKRTAQFVCAMALSDPAGQIRATAEASCRGRIALEPRGNGGFGYDPLFEIVEYRRTFGELSPDVKAILSHRARAARLILPQVARALGLRPV